MGCFIAADLSVRNFEIYVYLYGKFRNFYILFSRGYSSIYSLLTRRHLYVNIMACFTILKRNQQQINLKDYYPQYLKQKDCPSSISMMEKNGTHLGGVVYFFFYCDQDCSPSQVPFPHPCLLSWPRTLSDFLTIYKDMKWYMPQIAVYIFDVGMFSILVWFSVFSLI